MTRLSPDERGRALGLLEANYSARAIARRMNCHHRTITNLAERYQRTNSSRDRPRSGRPRVTTRRDDRHIERDHLRDRHLPAAQTADTFPGPNGVASRTVRRRLRTAGLHSRRPYVGPQLTPQHRQRRLQWAQQHLRWTRRDWRGVVFSDESRFSVSQPDGRIRVWRRRGERYRDDCVIQHNRGGGGSLMVWGAITEAERTPLVVIRGNMTGQRYRDEVLQPHLVPFFQAHPHLDVFQQDNATPHTSRIAMQFMAQSNIAVMPWPSLSPDMAPIEHAWDELGRRIRRGNPIQDVRDLERRLMREWANIPQDFFRNLIQSMRRRCQACIDAQGGHTRY